MNGGEQVKRLMSLDALRGFDMFFITGGSDLVIALCAALGFGDCWLAAQMHHVPWAGFAHHDTIFPLFLFLAGVSWPFSHAAQVKRGRTAWQIHRKVFVRMVTLFVMEMCLSGLLRIRPDFRLSGVLAYIGVSWGVAAILFMHVRRFGSRLALVAALLVGYWALLRFGIAPDAPAGADSYSKEWNIISYFDRQLWPTHLYVKGVYEPESLLSLAGGTALALLGMCTGAWLRNDAFSPAKRAGGLVLAAGVSFVLTLFFRFALDCAVVKALWTPSFVLAAATYSFATLALFYWLVDVMGWQKWTFYFRVIGMNSILIYVMMRLGVLHHLGKFLSGGCVELAGTPWGAVIRALGLLAAGWLVLYVCYRKNAFLKV